MRAGPVPMMAVSRVWESAMSAAIGLARLTGRRHRVERVGDFWHVVEVNAPKPVMFT